MISTKAVRRQIRNWIPPSRRDAVFTFLHGVAPVLPHLLRTYCIGRGLEIGAGKTPYCDPARTTFLDKNVDDKDATENADIVADADAIPVPDATYDYVFSSHVLEHVQNTIRTLNEWLRVLKPGGVMVAVLPHAAKTIDRFRAITPLQHHIDDFEKLTDDPDRSHFDEMRAGWERLGDPDLEEDYRRDWGVDPWDWEFRIKHSVLHYHVWTQHEITRLFQHLDIDICYVNEHVPERQDSFVVVGRKQGAVARS